MANLFSTGGTSLLIAVFLPAIGLLGVVVFFLRPRYAPARLLFVFAMASLGGFIALGPIGLAELWQPPVFFLYSLPAFFSVWQTAILPVLAHLLLIFPSVKGPLRRYPNVTLALIYVPAQAALWADFIIFRAQPAIFEQVYYSILVVTSLVIIATCVAALAHSFWTVRDPVGRAQLQWVAVGLLGGFMLGALSWLLAAVLGKPDDPVLLGISGLGFLLMPVCLSVAILRFRLFDIAILINRALVYGALTGILSVVFFGSVVLLQSVLALVSPVPNTALVTVLSTLAIAALFAPFRRRLQAIIDRHFNRRKYDGVRALQSFANGARDQVELDSLADSLLSVVDETMSPAHATLWLRSDAPR